MKPILLFALALAIHAQEASGVATVAPPGPCSFLTGRDAGHSKACVALTYQTARADAAEAALAVANRTLQMKQIEIEWYKAQLNLAASAGESGRGG